MSRRTRGGRTAGTRVASPDEPRLDVLSDVLSLMRLRGEVLCWSTLSAPWGLRFRPDEALYFHMIERGRCLLLVDGAAEHIEAEAGDLLVLPESTGYALLSARRCATVAIEDIVANQGGIAGRLRHGGGGAETDILCGRFRFDETLRMASLPGLPTVLHIKRRETSPEWLDLTLRYLSVEARNAAPGRDIALTRLVDLLFVQTIRHWLASTDSAPLAWIGAAKDPRIAKAVTLMHEKPEQPWDVGRLAAAVGMSRTRFGERFVDLIGEAPSKYLTRWRMHLAARLLRTPGTTIAYVAGCVGYESEAAFSRAFKRHMGSAPSDVRRSLR